MDVLRYLVEVWPIVVFMGVAIWWAATISRDVKSLKRDIERIELGNDRLRSDLIEIKAAVLK